MSSRRLHIIRYLIIFTLYICLYLTPDVCTVQRTRRGGSQVCMTHVCDDDYDHDTTNIAMLYVLELVY